jgi:hypothetical protein
LTSNKQISTCQKRFVGRKLHPPFTLIVAITVAVPISNDEEEERSNQSNAMPSALRIPLLLLLLLLFQQQIIGTMAASLKGCGCFLGMVIALRAVLSVRSTDETKKQHSG